MCNHQNILPNEYGTSTCADCHVHFEKSLCSEFTLNCNGRSKNFLKSSSTIINSLEKEFGINDHNTIKIAEKIFRLSSNQKTFRGNKRKYLLCASLYYAYYYLETPKDYEEILAIFKLDKKEGSKGIKICQMAIQEYPEDFAKLKGQTGYKIHSFTSSYKEQLKILIERYNIPLKYYNEIEKIIIDSHLRKNKILTDNSTNFWVACIFFWLLKINPYFELEEFISINETIVSEKQLKLDITFLQKYLYK